jgi:N utilization substance protein A
MRGYRVQAVVRELSGEKVDIVRFSSGVEEFTRNALAPAQITAIEVDEDAHHIVVVVPEGQLSLAIGRGGQNVRLAAKLIGWHLDIISEREREELGVREEAEAASSYDFLISLPGIGEKTAIALYEEGFGSADEILAAESEELASVPGLGPKSAEELKRKVEARLAELAEQGLSAPKPEDYMDTAPADKAEEGDAGTAAEEEEPEAEGGEPEAESEEGTETLEAPGESGDGEEAVADSAEAEPSSEDEERGDAGPE